MPVIHSVILSIRQSVVIILYFMRLFFDNSYGKLPLNLIYYNNLSYLHQYSLIAENIAKKEI